MSSSSDRKSPSINSFTLDALIAKIQTSRQSFGCPNQRRHTNEEVINALKQVWVSPGTAEQSIDQANLARNQLPDNRRTSLSDTDTTSNTSEAKDYEISVRSLKRYRLPSLHSLYKSCSNKRFADKFSVMNHEKASRPSRTDNHETTQQNLEYYHALLDSKHDFSTELPIGEAFVNPEITNLAHLLHVLSGDINSVSYSATVTTKLELSQLIALIPSRLKKHIICAYRIINSNASNKNVFIYKFNCSTEDTADQLRSYHNTDENGILEKNL
ncbi:hypothetical protein V1514DRAFT_336790, partial [Lipomyces japonicus]|uniref:uncharacterized protein n=1 Tax=Lipomyces japonicus TaxID=56871 RepID=UPI0034CE2898